MFKRTVIISAISVVSILLLIGNYFFEDDTSFTQIRADKGVMDLSTWNPEKDKRIVLDGEWEFYWGKLLSPADFQNDEIFNLDYIRVPSIWNGKEVNGQRFPSYGFATYRLKLTELPKDKVYALKKTNVRFASRIYVNGVRLLEDGQTSIEDDSFQPGNVPQMVLLD